MPANQKSWEKITRDEYDLFVRGLRSKGLIAPHGDSGLLRGGSSELMADLSFDEKAQEIHVRVRSVAKGETYTSFLNMLDDQIKRIDR